ncbi:MAG TPA: histidinol-phosphatase HisJ family protein [Promineifilum sp.]|nr:histidinol-phosphatase HisJ family protein [Promineifilum sp.]
MNTNSYDISSDYHMHSTFSMDGQDTIEALGWRALALGFNEIAITEHAEWHPAWRGSFDVDGYFAEIARCRALFAPQGLTLYSGVEMGNPHEFAREASALTAAYPFDVRIASLHWLHDHNIHDSACFAGHDPLDVYADYFVALGHMAADFSDIDVIAHFDRILWRGSLLGATFAPRAIENLVRDALATIAWRGLALELNTRNLNHMPNWRPALTTMLRWFGEEGGRRVVVNSDAHRVGQMGANLELAAAVLREAGLAATTLQPALVAAVRG